MKIPRLNWLNCQSEFIGKANVASASQRRPGREPGNKATGRQGKLLPRRLGQRLHNSAFIAYITVKSRSQNICAPSKFKFISPPSSFNRYIFPHLAASSIMAMMSLRWAVLVDHCSCGTLTLWSEKRK